MATPKYAYDVADVVATPTRLRCRSKKRSSYERLQDVRYSSYRLDDPSTLRSLDSENTL